MINPDAMDVLKILYEDNHIIAVWKPAGMATQPDNSGDLSLYDEVKSYLKEKYKKPGNVFLGIVQRLDRPVSGIVLFGKTSKGAGRLSEQIRERTISKKYNCLVLGKLSGRGIFSDMLAKDKQKNVSHISEEGGKLSELEYRVLKTYNSCSLLEINLKTGRSHQIRLQLASRGHPILGDVKYGAPEPLPLREIALAATSVSFKTATTDETVHLSNSIPEQWENYIK